MTYIEVPLSSSTQPLARKPSDEPSQYVIILLIYPFARVPLSLGSPSWDLTSVAAAPIVVVGDTADHDRSSGHVACTCEMIAVNAFSLKS